MQAQSAPIFVDVSGKTSSLLPVSIDKGANSFDESWLQRLIHENPGCLPVREIEPGFGSLVSICRELPTKHGPIDNLLMTAEGDLVLVEVKLWRNPEARRKVVAQALDYASCLFEMDYAELEAAVLEADFGAQARPSRLYDLLTGPDTPDEVSFIDAVNTNLRKGRALILVIGDGIRTEVQRLAGLVQSHAGAHFTFALVELSVFRMPEGDGRVVVPRTLMRTEMISRAVVEINDRRTSVTVPEEEDHRGTTSRVSENITAQQFYEAMASLRPDLPERLRAFLARLEPLGVYPEFRRSLILRWDSPEGNQVNLGYITRAGQIWTDHVNTSIPIELAHAYNEQLAAALDLEVEREAFRGSWHIRRAGKAPNLTQIAEKLDAWVPVVAELTRHLVRP